MPYSARIKLKEKRKMGDELTTAKMQIADLKEQLENATTAKAQDKLEAKLEATLKRLDALEIQKPKPKEHDGEDEDDNQCPECGGVLYDIGDGVIECSRCGALFEEE